MLNENIVIVANNFSIVNKIIVECGINYNIKGIYSETNTEKSYMGIGIFGADKLNEFIENKYLLIIADNENMLYFSKKFLDMKLNLFENYVPFYMVLSCIIDPVIIWQYVGGATKSVLMMLSNI